MSKALVLGSPRRPRRHGVLCTALLVSSLVALHCGAKAHKTSAKATASPSAQPSASSAALEAHPALLHARTLLAAAQPFSSRAQAIALSDELALGATLRTGPEKAEFIDTAARLRLRAYRSFHASTDAREAIELLQQAAKEQSPETACRTRLLALALQQELEPHLEQAWAQIYRARQNASGAACATFYANLTQTLGGYRPAPEQLAKLNAVQDSAESSPAAPTSTVIRPGPETPLGAGQLAAMQAFGGPDAARLVLQLSAPVLYKVGQLPPQEGQDGARVYVDLFETTLGKVPRQKPVGGLLEQVRLGAYQNRTRVVLQLKHPALARVFFLPEPFRIVLDLSAQQSRQEPKDSPAAATLRRVIIDPGHGGSDPGAIGPSGLKEKDVTLDIAHRLAPILSRELGITTLLTRDNDTFVALEERTGRANAFHADLFVSVHCNASESPASRGVQSYILDPSRDEAAARLAARENATSAAASHQVGALLGQFGAQPLGARSSHFAALLQQSALVSLRQRYNDTPDGGVRSATFFVLLGAQMPAVLFESSFISNPEEESRLATADYRQKLADGIANAVRAFQNGK